MFPLRKVIDLCMVGSFGQYSESLSSLVRRPEAPALFSGSLFDEQCERRELRPGKFGYS